MVIDPTDLGVEVVRRILHPDPIDSGVWEAKADLVQVGPVLSSLL